MPIIFGQPVTDLIERGETEAGGCEPPLTPGPHDACRACGHREDGSPSFRPPIERRDGHEAFQWDLVEEDVSRRLVDELGLADGEPRFVLEAALGKRLSAGLVRSDRIRVARSITRAWLAHRVAGEVKSLYEQIQPRGRATTKAERVRRLAEVKDPVIAKLVIDAFRTHPYHRGLVLSDGADEDITIRGFGHEHRALHDHQAAAIDVLDGLLEDERSGSAVLVLPTGAGKTRTAVSWLLDVLDRNPDWRVLWLAHTKELVDQAARALRKEAPERRSGFERVLRTVHGEAHNAETLAAPDSDIVVATWQSVLPRGNREAKLRRALDAFCVRPVLLVVDEAHHASAPSYQGLISAVGARFLLGLTATPFPADGTTFRATFRDRIEPAGIDELVARGILAIPQYTTIDTRTEVTLSAQDQADIRRRTDFTPGVLRRLDRPARDQVIVDLWRDDVERWGDTLVFAVDISHADHLETSFRRAGADARAVHSGRPDVRSTLAWFRSPGTNRVLIAVDMLNEGVDLPQASSAFLARPTLSPIVLRQMVGRVLRGPRAGGAAIANLVHFRDDFSDIVGALEPIDVPGLVPLAPAEQHGRAVQRMMTRSGPAAPANLSPEIRTAGVTGCYLTDHGLVPVLEHLEEVWAALCVDVAAGRILKGRHGFRSCFVDEPGAPSHEQVRWVVEYVRSYGAAPPLQRLDDYPSPRTVAHVLVHATKLTEADRRRTISDAFAHPVTAALWGSPAQFKQEVEREVDRLLERPRVTSPRERERLPRIPQRSLDRPIQAAMRRIEQMDPTVVVRPQPAASSIGWHTRPVRSWWGVCYEDGRIRINPILRTRRDIVSDELLGYLVYHELLHAVLPQPEGHSPRFRELELEWPNAVELDAVLDTLHDHWQFPWTVPTGRTKRVDD